MSNLLNRLYGNPKPIPLLSPQEGVALANDAAREIEYLRDENELLRKGLTFEAQLHIDKHELRKENEQIKADAALVVHALECAIILTENLIAFTPEGTTLHPGVASAKHNLDNAMNAIRGR